MIPSYYEFYNPVKILCGNTALENIPDELEQLGARRPLIVTDPGVVQAGLLDIVVQAFSGADVQIGAVFQDVPPDSSNAVVSRAAKAYRLNRCDSLIAVGGGSAIDTAKAVNIVITEGSDDLTQFMGANMLRKPMQPFVVVPTTAGTGSEVTSVAVISNPEKKVKMLFLSPLLFPKVGVLDPRMTLTMPPRITAATGMDALTHAVEAYTGLQKNPMSDAYATAAINLIREFLIPAVLDGKNAEARLGMANAALLAGASFSNSQCGVVHGLAHACGGVAHVPHGTANAILLPFGMEYNMGRRAAEYGELLLPLAGAEEYARTPAAERPARSVAAVRTMLADLNRLSGLPLTLQEAGVPRDRLEEIARTALGDATLIINPEEVDYDDALGLLKLAYA